MEVVGLVAGISGLAKLIQTSIVAVRGLSQRKSASKEANSLLQELEGYQTLLEEIKTRWTKDRSDLTHLQRLQPVFDQLHNELSAFHATLQRTGLIEDPLRSLKKTFVLSTGLEKLLGNLTCRLRDIKVSFTAIITHRYDAVAGEQINLTINGLRLQMHGILKSVSSDFVSRNTAGTCRWIWSHPVFRKWIAESNPPGADRIERILCVHGIKGCGKSVLAKSMAETFRDRNEICLHFAFWSGSDSQRRLIDLIRTILWQILEYVPDDAIRQLFKPLSHARDSARDLLRVVHKGLSLIDAPVHCLIDGLDESLDDWHSPGGECLSTLYELVKSHSNLYLMVLGRESSMWPLKRPVQRLEITQSCIQVDLQKLVAAELHHGLPIQNPQILDMIHQKLGVESQSMFLWITLVFKELRRCFSVGEMKQVLEQLPRDLDREYHRLFLRLAERTGGTSENPSIAMKRARCLLSLIMVSPEPLKVDELRYAYATQVDSNDSVEDCLIAVDGIADSCGDFVVVTEGHYHLIHASVDDFLSRPLEKWRSEDLDILYFRFDPEEAHRAACSACFKYSRSITMDDSLEGIQNSIPECQHFFLRYVIRVLPFHLCQVLSSRYEHWGRVAMIDFLKSAQFPAFIDYILMGLETDKNTEDSIGYWFGLFWLDLGWVSEELLSAYQIESQRRLQRFGAGDARYQTWTLLQVHTLARGPSSDEERAVTISQTANSRKLTARMLGSRFSALPSRMMQRQSIGIGTCLSQFSQGAHKISIAFQGLEGISASLMALSVNSLPASVILAAAQNKWLSGDLNTAHRLTETSVMKSTGSGGVIELASTVRLGYILLQMPSPDFRRIEDLLRKSTHLADLLPNSPYVEWLKMESIGGLAKAFTHQEKDQELKGAIQRFRSLVGKDRKKSSSRAWELYISRSHPGIKYRILAFIYLADSMFRCDEYHSIGFSLLDEALGILEDAGPKLNGCMRTILKRLVVIYFHKCQDRECVDICKQLLVVLGVASEASDQQNEENQLRLFTHHQLAMCLASLGDMDGSRDQCQEAKRLLLSDSFTKQLFSKPDWYSRQALRFLIYYEGIEYCQLLYDRMLDAMVIPNCSIVSLKTFVHIGALFSKMEQAGLITAKFGIDMHAFQLLVDQSSLQGLEAWEGILQSTLVCIDPSNRAGGVPGCLKFIDKCLGLDDGMDKAIQWYKELAHYYVCVGQFRAAEMVTEDAASRCHANSSQNIQLLRRAAFFSKQSQPPIGNTWSWAWGDGESEKEGSIATYAYTSSEFSDWESVNGSYIT